MKRRNGGFGGLQFVLVFAIIGVASIFAVPEYKSYLAKAKLSEAFKLASASKKKLSEFYMLNGRFPRNDAEARMMNVQTVAPPEYVRELVVSPAESEREVLIRVYLKDGILENPASEDQFIYVAGNGVDGGSYGVTWSCGGNGFDPALLPRECGS